MDFQMFDLFYLGGLGAFLLGLATAREFTAPVNHVR